MSIDLSDVLPRFVDRDMFMRFTGYGIGHKATYHATKMFREDIDAAFGKWTPERDEMDPDSETEGGGVATTNTAAQSIPEEDDEPERNDEGDEEDWEAWNEMQSREPEGFDEADDWEDCEDDTGIEALGFGEI